MMMMMEKGKFDLFAFCVNYFNLNSLMAGLSIKQRKELRKFLARRKAQRLAKTSSNFNVNFFSRLKNTVKSWFTK